MYQKEKSIIIFGASSGGTKVAQAFESMNISISCFVDNDSGKWGKELEGREIRAPESILEDHKKYQIIIASEYQSEIEKQLKEMGILDCLLLKEEVIMNYVKEHIEEFKTERKRNSFEKLKNAGTVIFDLLDGFQLGGIENWSYMAAAGLKKKNYNVYLYSNITLKEPVLELKNCVRQFDTDFKRYWALIHELVESIINELPCTLIINKQRQLLIAGSIVKRLYPDQIKIISVLHNDRIDIYRRQAYMEKEVDTIACVSNDIREYMIQEFGINPKKVVYKESPVPFNDAFIKEYSLDSSQPIQIAYAARIEKVQKRADLFFPLIDKLEEYEINYQLHIAGTGSYEQKLKEYIQKKNLQKRIIMHGYLKKDEMQHFWKKKDIFINLSDYEGVGLSMLEAMSYGCVPIVTKVAGSTEFIEAGKTGFICSKGDMTQMALKIKELEAKRDKLPTLGIASRKKIKIKCSEKDYIDYLNQLIYKK